MTNNARSELSPRSLIMTDNCENLIILGAGATAAISDGALPVGEDFFAKNEIWSSKGADYPHLAVACRKVAHLKSMFGWSSSVSLTDIWLFLDTVLKYHAATRRNCAYDCNLLRNRYENMSGDTPVYLQLNYLNANYSRIADGMHPMFSPLRKSIYDTFPQDDAVVYFLVIAGWELKHLLYRTYDPKKPENELKKLKLYTDLLKELNGLKGLSIISFNYDIYFEKACGKQLQLLTGNTTSNDNSALDFCKPHGGWNIQHIDNSIVPFCNLTEFVKEQSFDKLPSCEVRPAMIPYFSPPDEIEGLHRERYPLVGKYFRDQHDKMKKLFQNAKNIVSIGYSFSKDDRHVRNIMDGLPKINGRGKRLFCVLKGCHCKKNIMELWQFKEDDGKTFRFDKNGFNDEGESIKKISEFFGNNGPVA